MPGRTRSDSSEDDEEYESHSSNDEDDESGQSSDDESAVLSRRGSVDAKHNLVDEDLNEIRRMIEEMDKIKMRLQFRLSKERENGASGVSHPARRQSSAHDIFVPRTLTASVQTPWDMARAFDVEKVIDPSERSTPTVQQAPIEQAPVGPSVHLSLQDLAKSYGVAEAPPATPTGLHGSTIPSTQEVRAPSASSEASAADPFPMPTKRKSSLWEGLSLKSLVGSEARASQSGPMDGSGPSPSTPPNAPKSSIFDVFDTLAQSFGPPSSPKNSTTGIARQSSGTAQGDSEAREKTMTQKEMEAVQGLLFH